VAKLPAVSSHEAEADCWRLDAKALAELARSQGERYLALLNLEEFRLTQYPRALGSARFHLRWAREHWRRLADIADHHYAPMFETMRMRTQAYRWASQLPVIDGDLAYLNSLENVWDLREAPTPEAAVAHLPGRGAAPDVFPAEDASWPVQWRDTSFVWGEVGGRVAVRALIGTAGLDVDDGILWNDDADAAIDLPYWDPGPGCGRTLRVAYDRAGAPFGVMAEAGTIRLGRARGWSHVRLALPHARFAGSGPGFSDIVVTSSDGAEVDIQPPRLEIVRAPPPHLDLQFVMAMKHTPAQPTIHWRVPGGKWKTAALVRGIGLGYMEAETRGPEIYRFEIPRTVSEIEYFFTATSKEQKRRLPEKEGAYRWRRHADRTPPRIDALAVGQTRRQEGRVEVRARVDDSQGVARVVVYFKPLPSDKLWQEAPMEPAGGDDYRASVPLTAEGLQYRVAAWDKAGNAALYPDFERETPYRVIPSWNPTSSGR
jgi:hypothetical protein